MEKFFLLLEIMHRLPTALPPVRQILLEILRPWLYNLELVDPNMTPLNTLEHLPSSSSAKDLGGGGSGGSMQDVIKPPLKGRGWGSPEATNMVLNNFLYATLTVSVIRITFSHTYSNIYQLNYWWNS